MVIMSVGFQDSDDLLEYGVGFFLWVALLSEEMSDVGKCCLTPQAIQTHTLLAAGPTELMKIPIQNPDELKV